MIHRRTAIAAAVVVVVLITAVALYRFLIVPTPTPAVTSVITTPTSPVATPAEKLLWKEGWPRTIRIGAAPPGGGFYMAASAIANVLSEVFKIEVIVEQTKASVHNIKLMEEGYIELGMATTDTTWEAWYGKGEFEKEYRGFRVLMPGWPGPYMFVTLEKYGIKSIWDFNGKRVSALSLGSATDVFVRKVFSTLKINATIVNLAPSDSIEALKAGAIQGFAIGHPAPSVVELARTEKVRIITLSGKDAEIFLQEHPEYTYPLTIPAGYYYPEQPELPAVGMYNIVIVRADLPEDLVYTILKALYSRVDIINATWPAMAKGMSPENVKLMKAPLHPGAERFYRELGVVK
jgi:TRAP transporter TAXI family solute receptor